MQSSLQLQGPRPSQLMALERSIPPVLRPLVRAYVLGYASSTVPRLLALLVLQLNRKRKTAAGKPHLGFTSSAAVILRKGLELQRFPAFCAALIGGSTLLEARDLTLIKLEEMLTVTRFLFEDCLLVWLQTYHRRLKSGNYPLFDWLAIMRVSAMDVEKRDQETTLRYQVISISGIVLTKPCICVSPSHISLTKTQIINNMTFTNPLQTRPITRNVHRWLVQLGTPPVEKDRCVYGQDALRHSQRGQVQGHPVRRSDDRSHPLCCHQSRRCGGRRALVPAQGSEDCRWKME